MSIFIDIGMLIHAVTTWASMFSMHDDVIVYDVTGVNGGKNFVLTQQAAAMCDVILLVT